MSKKVILCFRMLNCYLDCNFPVDSKDSGNEQTGGRKRKAAGITPNIMSGQHVKTYIRFF